MSATVIPNPAGAKLTAKDFKSDQEVRWCPGCGDYSVMAQVQRVLPELGVPRENVVFISGIGCSSRFPYYMNTYGFHTIHGRAAAIATGVKLSRPDLQVWVVTGDGDSLAIGGNHFIHALRRNVDLKILLFNNRIYGLTKGQFSPTSEMGKKTKTTPYGSTDRPFNPVQLSIGSGATFVARTIDSEPAHMQQMIARMAKHKGAAVLEVLQNCVVFNDGAFTALSDKTSKDDTTVRLEHGKPVVFAKGTKGIRISHYEPEVVTLGQNGVTEKDLLVWDEACPQALGFALSSMAYPTHPEPMGVFRAVEAPALHEREATVKDQVQTKKGIGDLTKLFASGDTWTVGG